NSARGPSGSSSGVGEQPTHSPAMTTATATAAPHARIRRSCDTRDACAPVSTAGYPCVHDAPAPEGRQGVSDREAEGAHHVAAVAGDALRAPRRHPHPVDAEPLHDVVERLSR